MKKIVLATHNKGKIREFSAALADIGLVGVPISELTNVDEPEETGTTFMENALLKATYYMNACQLPCMADDSGLSVRVLNGEPGIYSARYAGIHGNDDDNNAKLLENLTGVPFEERDGQYVCALALVYPNGSELTAEGYCDGFIQDDPVGEGGFGYDPYFYLPEYKQTMAELSMTEKNKISHRGRALALLMEQLQNESNRNS